MPFTLIVSFVVTWTIGLLPPLAIRYVIVRRPIHQWSAIIICALLWLFNFALFSVLGSRSKYHGALALIAFASYWILRTSGFGKKALSESDIGKFEFTELMYFSAEGNIERVCQLLAAGVPVNDQDRQGKTALMYAVMNCHAPVVETLLNIGADITCVTKSGHTAAWFARKQGREDIVKLIESAGVRSSVSAEEDAPQVARSSP